MNTNFQFSVFLTIILIATSIGCTLKDNIRSQKVKEDAAANTAIVSKMKSRTYNLDVKSASNSISEVLSNINKSARLLENEIGLVVLVETGHSDFHEKQDSIKQEQEDEGNTFSNTFKYSGINDILLVRVRASELSTGSTNIVLTFIRIAVGHKKNYIRPLPPKFTLSIYNKLWSAIEKELK